MVDIKLSEIIPATDNEAALRQTMESLHAQTFREIEVLHPGSDAGDNTEQTRDLVLGLESVLASAQGEFLAFLNPGDTIAMSFR